MREERFPAEKAMRFSARELFEPIQQLLRDLSRAELLDELVVVA